MVVSSVSLTVVAAGVASNARFSKLPPVAPVMRLLTEPASTTASSAGAGTVTEPLDAPLRMVMVAPLCSVTVTLPCAGAVSEAV